MKQTRRAKFPTSIFYIYLKFFTHKNVYGGIQIQILLDRGQNSLGQMFFALKEAFPVCKLLPFTANAPLPPLQCWLLKEDILVNSSMKFSSAFNIAMGGGGGGSQLEISSKIQSVS